MTRADPDILDLLRKELVKDWYELRLFSEYDLQCATYFWLRKHFDSERNDSWTLRTQPTLESKASFWKPDIVIYRNDVPYDAIELKFQMDGFTEAPIARDFEKFRKLKREWGLRHAYMFVLYDDADTFSLTKDEWMKNYLTLVGVNVRLLDDGTPRRDYKRVRQQWERYKGLI